MTDTMTITDVGEADDENMVDVEFTLDDDLIRSVVEHFDTQRLTRETFITAEEFKYVPKNIQDQVKIAIVTGIALQRAAEEGTLNEETE
jgi:hypothetical protein